MNDNDSGAQTALHDNTDVLYDVAFVGLGPVSQILGLLLARRGHSIVSFERQRQPYPLPRAVHIDPDVVRVLDELGVADELDGVIEVARVYEWQNADRETLLRFEFRAEGEQRWADSYMFHQPGLERALKAAGERMGESRIAIRRGTEVVGIEQSADSVRLRVRDIDGSVDEASDYRARFVVGADGANSFVRRALGIEVHDFGLRSRWVVVDALGELDLPEDPDNLQVCDPACPWTSVAGGPGRRRYEFMARDDEDLAELASEGWYELVCGLQPVFYAQHAAWLTNDEANHRIALLRLPGTKAPVDKPRTAGLHHTAFEYANFDQWIDNYARLRDRGILPSLCIDHGMTMSMYYVDPDGNGVEIQVDNFGDWGASKEWMWASQEFSADQVGPQFDPEKLLEARDSGLDGREIHDRVYRGEYLPAEPYEMLFPDVWPERIAADPALGEPVPFPHFTEDKSER